MTTLAVATWGIPFAFLAASILVPGDAGTPGHIALVAGAVALISTDVVWRWRLRRRGPPALYYRYRRVSEWTMFVCVAALFPALVASAAVEGEWGDAYFYGYTAALLLFALFPRRRTGGGAPRSSGSV